MKPEVYGTQLIQANIQVESFRIEVQLIQISHLQWQKSIEKWQMLSKSMVPWHFQIILTLTISMIK